MRPGRFLRQTSVVARRDYVTTALSPGFLFFLLSPLVLLGISILSDYAAKGPGRAAPAMVVVLSTDGWGRDVAAADRETVLPGTQTNRARLVVVTATSYHSAQAADLVRKSGGRVRAVLHGDRNAPRIVYASGARAEAQRLLVDAKLAREGAKPDVQPTVLQAGPHGPSFDRAEIGTATVFALYIATFLLTSQVVSAFSEERTSKILDLVASAVPIEAIFLGKILAELALALTFVGIWVGGLSTLVLLASGIPGSIPSNIGIATGWFFPAIFLVYFSLSYMLQSSAILGVCSLATTPRGTRAMTLPLTFLQFSMFWIASTAVLDPGGRLDAIAKTIPFSSPLVMAAHAAMDPDLYVHPLAMAWQALWVGIVVTLSGIAFRRGALGSRSPARAGRRGRPARTDTY